MSTARIQEERIENTRAVLRTASSAALQASRDGWATYSQKDADERTVEACRMIVVLIDDELATRTPSGGAR